MAATGSKAYVRKLFRDFPVFHWFGSVDEGHYLDFTEYIKDLGELVTEKEGGRKRKWPKKVVLYLNSHGGDLSVAEGFYDYVRLSGLHLVTIATGDVESAATVLFLAGEKRYASRFSSFLVHDPEFEGHFRMSIRNVKQTGLHVTSMHDRHVEIVALASGLTVEKVDELSFDALPLSAGRAKELGIVHEIF